MNSGYGMTFFGFIGKFRKCGSPASEGQMIDVGVSGSHNANIIIFYNVFVF